MATSNPVRARATAALRPIPVAAPVTRPTRLAAIGPSPQGCCVAQTARVALLNMFMFKSNARRCQAPRNFGQSRGDVLVFGYGHIRRRMTMRRLSIAALALAALAGAAQAQQWPAKPV